MSVPPSRRSRTGSLHLRTTLWRLLQRAALCALVGAPYLVAHAQDEPASEDGDAAACRIAAPDPRIDELLQADPTDPRIDITSDTGELGRAGDATLSGNVTIRTGQRLLKADQAEVDAERRSVRLRGRSTSIRSCTSSAKVARSSRAAADSSRARSSNSSSARFAAPPRARVSGDGKMQLDGVRYTACSPGVDDWELQAGEIVIDQKSQIGTGRDVKLEFLGVPVLYTPWISFPIGDQRKFGLLFPMFGNSSQSGTMVAVP